MARYRSDMVEQAELPGPRKQISNGQLVEKNDDGSVTVHDGPEPRIPQKGDFDGDITDLLERAERMQLCQRLTEYFDADLKSRASWEATEKRSLKMMGIDTGAPGIPKESAPSEQGGVGINEVTHPALLEACQQFSIRAFPELFPAEGPVKERILGQKTPERIAQAERVVDFMNYYLTVMDDGYYPDSDQMLFYLPMAGSAFRKGGQNYITGFPELRYVKASSFVAPYSGRELKKMSRYCHPYTMSRADIELAMENGSFYAQAELLKVAADNGENNLTDDTADMRTASSHDDDQIHSLREYHVDLILEEDPWRKKLPAGSRLWRTLPYIVIYEKDSNEILMIRRNWRQRDKQFRKRVWFTHHKFLPGLGFYGFGFPHVIGSLGAAASGCVNGLLDAAIASNSQGGFKSKEARGLGGVTTITPGVWKDCDLDAETLAKAFYTPPFGKPEPAMFHLLEGLVMALQRFAGTTDVAVGEASNTGPVGTTVALLEEARRPQAAIHKRLYQSMGIELKMMHDLIFDLAPVDGEYEYDQNQQTKKLLKSDFDGRCDVIPVADPKIFSQTQKITQAQNVIELQGRAPQLYQPPQMVAAHRAMLKAMQVQDWESMAPKIDEPLYIDPVAENGYMLIGKGTRAFEAQEHQAHMTVHQNGMEWALAGNPDPADQKRIQATFMAHIREHQALMYRAMVFQRAHIPPPPLDEQGLPQSLPPDMERQISAMVAKALPPAPTPPQENEGQQVLDKAQATIKAKDMEAQANIERDTKSFAAEEQRLEHAFQNEQRRLNVAAVNEQRRKDATVAATIEGGLNKTAADIANKGKAAEHDGQRKDQAAIKDLGRKDAQHGQVLEQTGEKHEQALGQADDQHEQQLSQAGEQHEQGLAQEQQAHEQSTQHADDGQAQALAHAEETQKQSSRQDSADHRRQAAHDEDDHQRTVKHDDEAHEQAIEHLEQDHEQGLKQTQAEHDVALEHQGEDHKVAVQQTKETGKLKVQQAKEQARAKKQANAKRKPKK